MLDSTPLPIQLAHLHYVIDSKIVLDGIDLTVKPAEIVAVMGRSGSGKTTLLRLIMGLIPPTSGHILVNGIEISRLSEHELDPVRIRMGMVFQAAALFDSMTISENVALGMVEHSRLTLIEIKERVERLLNMVEMAGTENLLPAQLSGGMRKRVGIARALAMEPSIMLYDEPTSGLDPISAAAIDDLILHLRDRVGVSSIIVSHDLQSLRRVADRAALLHRGQFLAVGPLDELEGSEDPALQQFLSGSPKGPLTEEAEP